MLIFAASSEVDRQMEEHAYRVQIVLKPGGPILRDAVPYPTFEVALEGIRRSHSEGFLGSATIREKTTRFTAGPISKAVCVFDILALLPKRIKNPAGLDRLPKKGQYCAPVSLEFLFKLKRALFGYLGVAIS
jgi:hypothetical protein